MTDTELQDMMRRAQRVEWITDRVLEGVGNVEFCRTEDGRIGVFMRQEPMCRGIGATAGEAIDNAIRRGSGIPSSVVLAVDPSWSTPDALAPAVPSSVSSAIEEEANAARRRHEGRTT